MRQSNCVWNPCKCLGHVYRDNSGHLVWWRHQPSAWKPHQPTIMMVVSIIYWRLDHNDFVVNFDKDSSIVVEVKLSVDVVLSRGRHRQFSVFGMSYRLHDGPWLLRSKVTTYVILEINVIILKEFSKILMTRPNTPRYPKTLPVLGHYEAKRAIFRD